MNFKYSSAQWYHSKKASRDKTTFKSLGVFMSIACTFGFTLPLSACQSQQTGDELVNTVSALTAAKPNSRGRPNIIVIIADDLGYGDIGANGGRIPTPNIDALAASGVRMTHGYATAAVCAPSRAGLMVGRQQTRFGFEFNPAGRDTQRGMSVQETTIAQTLKSAGYRTGIVGKWHLGQAEGFAPLDRGFDSFYGILGGATPYMTAIGPNDLHVETAEDKLITRDRLPIFDGRTRVEPTAYVTDLFTDKAIEFAGKEPEKPFFLYLAYTAPHTPLQAPAKYLLRASNQPSDYHKVYTAMLTALDDGIGRLVQHLKSSGAYENTLIVFLSDNGCPSYIGGACSNAPLQSWKGYPWDGGTRVPFIVSWPQTLAPGVYTNPVSALDIAVTTSTAAGVTHPGAEGLDLVSLVQDQSPQSNRALFWRMGPTRIVREGRWKLIVVNRAAPGGAATTERRVDDLARSMRPDGIPATVSALGQWTLLYDLQTDPGEKFNLAEQHPEKVKDLLKKWDAWNEKNVEPQWTSRRGVAAEVENMWVEMFN
ncbi:MAG: sulfatase-like hydrolase/transferase [Aquidulcibacter sp.]|uniref:sulfatase family protein n=1 Tax=Aquidulcibacter sp. TaxID=2052990 RepID=UPI0022C0C4C6|nr:sulfatase-like hydrolase/transferase [Aquidulcibacter sp.]